MGASLNHPLRTICIPSTRSGVPIAQGRLQTRPSRQIIGFSIIQVIDKCHGRSIVNRYDAYCLIASLPECLFLDLWSHLGAAQAFFGGTIWHPTNILEAGRVGDLK